MKMSKFRIAVLVLLALTMVYAAAFYQSYKNYEAWKQELIKQNPIYGTEYVTWEPFLATMTAGYLMLVGFGLFGLWILLFTYSDKLKGLKPSKPELNTLEACHRLALKEGQKENET